MWVVVFLAACASADATTVRWSFADHRTCAEANVVTVAVREGAREVVRVPCESSSASLGAGAIGDGALVVEALAYHGTALYRGHADVTGPVTSVTLRYVGGAD